MTILTATNISQSFGDNDLFEDINLNLDAKYRVGLVGPNGVGKTTLLLILSGLQEPMKGEVHRARDLTVGYLRQEAVLTFRGQDNTIYEEMLSVFADLRQMEAQMRQMEAAMSAGGAAETLVDAYGRLQEQYELGGGYLYQVDIKRVLLGLGFEQETWTTPLSHLSGGEKTRVLLGRLLLEKPELLILDEPTNHLDVAAIEWLEHTLRTWTGALIIVSHDRYFLDKIVNQIWEMTPDRFTTYRGSYSSYVQQRQEAWERELRLFEAEKERLEAEITFIKKNIAGGKTDIAKGKLKRLTRDVVLIEQTGVVDSQGKSWIEIGGRVRTFSPNEAVKRIQALKPPANRPPRLNIKLDAEQLSGRVVLRSKKLTIGYPDTPLFTTGKLRLERYDCAALIGPNGSGKTTFLRTLRQELSPLSGKIYFGDNVQVGYFAQAHDQLTLSHRVLDEVLAHQDFTEQEARNYLAQYLFRGHDVFKKVAELSGGERGRLSLAILALQGANFLLLDEPTNHLDIPSQETLQEVLEAFDGTILLVSHDRYLVSRLATQIWELRDGRLHTYQGTYEAFIGEREAAIKEEIIQQELTAHPLELDWVEEIAVPPTKKEKKKKKRQRYELAAEIEEAESWLEQILFDIETAESMGDKAALPQLQDELKVIQARLDTLTAEYDDLP